MLAAGFNVEAIHGDLTQAKRESVMNAFKNDEIKFLVATDVASRGLDVEGITHVFNYNLPDEPENYVHRIGRTGRAGNNGIAYTIFTTKDSKRLEAIEAFINMKINRISVSEETESPTEKSKPVDSKKNHDLTQSHNNSKTLSKQNSVKQKKKRKSFSKG